jgi:hypothetical protein
MICKVRGGDLASRAIIGETGAPPAPPSCASPMNHSARSIEHARQHVKAVLRLMALLPALSGAQDRCNRLVFGNRSYTPFVGLLQGNRIPADFAIRPAARECAMQAAPGGLLTPGMPPQVRNLLENRSILSAQFSPRSTDQ